MLYRGRPSWLYYVVSLALGAVFVLFGLLFLVMPEAAPAGMFTVLLGGAILLKPLVGVYSSEYLVSRDTVTQREGLLSRNTSEVEAGDIRNIQVRQGIVERLFGLGSVLVSSAGQGGVEIAFAGIKAPEAVAERIRQLRRKQEPATAAQAAG